MREIRADDRDARLGWLLVAGTIPVGIIGLLLRDPLRKLFASPQIGRGLPDRQRRRAAAVRAAAPAPAAAGGLSRATSTRASPSSAGARRSRVGTSQAAALIPGISRSGFTMGGGLLVGLSNEDAARFGFLLATPVIFAAAALKLPELFGSRGRRRARPGARRGPVRRG